MLGAPVFYFTALLSANRGGGGEGTGEKRAPSCDEQTAGVYLDRQTAEGTPVAVRAGLLFELDEDALAHDREDPECHGECEEDADCGPLEIGVKVVRLRDPHVQIRAGLRQLRCRLCHPEGYEVCLGTSDGGWEGGTRAQ